MAPGPRYRLSRAQRPAEETAVKRVRIQRSRARRERDWREALPPDPDVVQANALAQAGTGAPPRHLGRAGRGARPGHWIRPAGSGSAERRHPILIGYDGSSASRHALAYAAGMARRLDGWLVVVHVWRGDGLAFVPLTERMQWLRRELADADLTGLRIEMIIRHGVPARELRRVTAERVADAIVIGAAERFPHRFAGSVPGRLARHARCPAVVVP
ncbi:MAG: universal stress protein [Streptosporangiaceae bacterium]